MQLNRVIIAGNLTRDPELRYSQSGTAVSKATIAVNRKWGKGDDQKEEVSFIDVTAFGKQAEQFGEYKKGQNVIVDGRLKLESWEDKQTKEKRSKLGVICEGFPGLIARNDAVPDGGQSSRAPKREEKPDPEDQLPGAEVDDSSVPF